MAIKKTEKDSIIKKRRKRPSLDFNDSYKRQKFLCQYYDSILPSGQGGEIISRPILGKGEDPESYQYNENDYWMTYFVHQHQLLLQIGKKSAKASSDTTEFKNFLRLKAFYEEIENNFLLHVLSISKASISELLTDLRSQGCDIRNEDINIPTRLMKIRHKLPPQYRIETSHFKDFLDYIQRNEKEINETNEELITEAFIKLLIWSDMDDEHGWFKYFDNDLNKFFDHAMVDIHFVIRIIKLAKRLGGMNEHNSEGYEVSEGVALYITGYYKKLLDFANQILKTRNEIKHKTFASTEMINDSLQKFDPNSSEESNDNIAWHAKSLFTNDFFDYLKKILVSKYAGDFHNQRMERLKFVLNTDSNLHYVTIYNLTDIQLHEEELRSDITYGLIKMPKNCNTDKEYLMYLMQQHSDLLKHFISGFVQAFAKIEYWNKIFQPKEEHYLKAEKMKMYIAHQVLEKAVIDGKKWIEHLDQSNYWRREWRKSVEDLLVQIRLASVKGSDMSKAKEDVKKLCEDLQNISNVFKRDITDENTKIYLVNLLESVKTVLLNNNVQLNYHLLHYCLDHAEFNQYLVTLLKTTGNISSEQFKKHFFQLGLYSGFVKRDEERDKRLNERSRKNYIFNFVGKAFKSYKDSMGVKGAVRSRYVRVNPGRREFRKQMTSNLESDVAQVHNKLELKKTTKAAIEGEKLRQQGIVGTKRHNKPDIPRFRNNDDSAFEKPKIPRFERLARAKKEMREAEIVDIAQPGSMPNFPRREHVSFSEFVGEKSGNQRQQKIVDTVRNKPHQQNNPVNNRQVAQPTSVSHFQNAPHQYAPQYFLVDQYGRQVPADQYGRPLYQEPIAVIPYQQPIAVIPYGQQVATHLQPSPAAPVQSYYQQPAHIQSYHQQPAHIQSYYQQQQPAYVMIPQSTSENNVNPHQSKGVSSKRKLHESKLSPSNTETQLEIYRRKIHKYEEKIQRLDEIINGSEE